MNLMLQIAAVLAVCLAGEWISSFLPIPVPSSVVSMVVLFILLMIKAVKAEHIRHFSGFLLKNMGFFFIPAGVGLVESFAGFSEHLIQLIIICAVNTLLTFCAAAFTVTGVINLQRKWERRRRK